MSDFSSSGSRRSENDTVQTEHTASVSSSNTDGSSNQSTSSKGATSSSKASRSKGPISILSSSARRTSSANENEQRFMEAERVLTDIAKEFAAKRAAGLVPTVPVPARTLLWEEMARNERTRMGKRGQCIYGRDTGSICGCTHYKRVRIPGERNPGGICECCQHGACWHRLTGGHNLLSRSTSTLRSRSSKASRLASMLRSAEANTQYSMNGSEYLSGYSEYDDEYDDDYDEYDDEDDEDLDEEAIALELARPMGAEMYVAAPGLAPYPHRLMSSQEVPFAAPSGHAFRNSSSSGPGFSTSGMRPQISTSSSSATSNELESLLKAIAKYRQLGLADDEIEARIRVDFAVHRGAPTPEAFASSSHRNSTTTKSAL